MTINKGAPRPLGATWTKQGVNFAVFSSRATRVEVCLFDAGNGAEIVRYDLPGRTGDVWHGLISPRHGNPGTHYAFYVHGPNDPQSGQRFDASVPLIDPYAHALSSRPPLRGCVIDPAFHWGGDRPPTIPWRDTVIYELHVKGFTRLHPAVPGGNQAVPHVAGAAGQIVACDLGAAFGVVKTDFDPRRVAREHGDVDALLGPGRAERPGCTGIDGQFRGAFKSPASPPKYGPRTRERFDRSKSNPCSSN